MKNIKSWVQQHKELIQIILLVLAILVCIGCIIYMLYNISPLREPYYSTSPIIIHHELLIGLF